MPDCNKIYIDTRFKTTDSKSDSYFTIELPQSSHIPEDTICYVNYMSLPGSWTTIDEVNNKL